MISAHTRDQCTGNVRVYKFKNCGNQTLWVDSALVLQVVAQCKGQGHLVSCSGQLKRREWKKVN